MRTRCARSQPAAPVIARDQLSACMRVPQQARPAAQMPERPGPAAEVPGTKVQPALGSAQGGAASHTGRHGAPGKRRSAQSWCSRMRAETTAAGVHSSWTCSTRQPAVKLEGRELRGPQSGSGCDEPLACVGAAAARESAGAADAPGWPRVACSAGSVQGVEGPPPALAPCPVISSAETQAPTRTRPPCRAQAPNTAAAHLQPTGDTCPAHCSPRRPGRGHLAQVHRLHPRARWILEHLVVNDYY